MSAELTPQQALAIYSLVFAPEAERRPLKSKLPLDKPQRDVLVKAGLLELEPVKPQGERVSLTDKGWGWAAEHLGAVKLSKSQATVSTLQGVLERLQQHLAASQSSLASFASSVPSAKRAAPVANDVASPARDLASRIRTTCLDLGRGATRTRVRLRELRARLPDVAREHLDHELVELQNTGALVLYRIDDPTDIKPEDERAALHVAGAPRHIIYLEH